MCKLFQCANANGIKNQELGEKNQLLIINC